MCRHRGCAVVGRWAPRLETGGILGEVDQSTRAVLAVLAHAKSLANSPLIGPPEFQQLGGGLDTAFEHADVGMSLALADELASQSIRVNTVHPTGVPTGMAPTSLHTLLVERRPDLGPIVENDSRYSRSSPRTSVTQSCPSYPTGIAASQGSSQGRCRRDHQIVGHRVGETRSGAHALVEEMEGDAP